MPKILVVEDVPDIRFLLVETLVDAGYQIVEAGDGVAGLASARQHRPDVILLDVMMPVMDGFQMLEAAKADPTIAGIPIIMVTAKGQEQDQQKAIQAGAFSFLVKPWSHQEVETQIRRALAAQHAAA
jgi:CheY-like chemotaxis protein